MNKKWRFLTCILAIAMLFTVLPAAKPADTAAAAGAGLKNVAREAVSLDAWFEDSYGLNASLVDTWWSINGLIDGAVPIFQDGDTRVLGWYSQSSAASADLYLQITLAASYDIEEVILYPIGFLNGFTFPDTYEVLISANGNDWTKIGEDANCGGQNLFPNGVPASKSYNAGSQRARFVMLHITRLVNPGDNYYYAALGEIEVMAAVEGSVGHAEGLIDVDEYGELGDEIVGVSFDNVAYDNVIQTTDGAPLDYATLSNYLPGYAWKSGFSPINLKAPDCPTYVGLFGWIGFDQPITAFGYIIGDRAPVFDPLFMQQAEEGVLQAGGQYAKRFAVTIPIKEAPDKGTTAIYAVVQLADGKIIVLNSDRSYLYLGIGFEVVGDVPTGGVELNIEACNLAFENDTYILYAVSGEVLDNVKLLVWTEPRSSYTYGTQAAVLEPVETRVLQGTEMLVFEYTGFAAKQMTKDIYARAFLDEGGLYSYSPLKKYSILQYVYNKTGRTGTASANQNLINVLNAMIAFGAAAQRYSNYDIDRQATDDFYQIKTEEGLIFDRANHGLYRPGDRISLMAPPIDGSGNEFSHWENAAGDVFEGRTAEITVGTADETYTAVYEPSALPYVADFRVANVFGSDMVVQRGDPVKVWGFADSRYNGGKVYGEFKGVEAEAVIIDGRWDMTFEASFEADANPGNDMRFYTAGKEEVLRNVLIGDVYFVIGQSNVAYDMSMHWTYVDDDEVDRCSRKADLDYPIRLAYNTHLIPNSSPHGSATTITDINQKSNWKVATKSKLQSFSAMGYLFAWNFCRLTDSTVPVGIIEFDGNGRALGCFLPNELANKYHSDTYNASTGLYVVNGGQEGRFMYNDYMVAYDGLPLAGIVWYQGESDFTGTLTNNYHTVYKEYMDFLREKHNGKDLPVYFVEFPPIFQQPSSYPDMDKYGWQYMDVGMIRGRMGSMVLLDDNFYQVESSDLWNDRTFWNNLHPNCKNEQALRAAKIACAVLGEGDISMAEASGPVVESITFASDRKSATIKYKNVGDGLRTTDGSAVKGFQYGRSANAVNGTISATITGTDTVVVQLTGTVARLYTISSLYYNCQTSWVFGTDINLCNSAGIPAGAFRMNYGDF